MVLQIKVWRKEVDALVKLVDEVDELPEALALGYNLAACKNTLQFAKAWMGMMLAELDEPTPYVNDGKRHTVADINKTADTGEDVVELFKNGVMSGQKKHWLEMNKIEKLIF